MQVNNRPLAHAKPSHALGGWTEQSSVSTHACGVFACMTNPSTPWPHHVQAHGVMGWWVGHGSIFILMCSMWISCSQSSFFALTNMLSTCWHQNEHLATDKSVNNPHSHSSCKQLGVHGDIDLETNNRAKWTPLHGYSDWSNKLLSTTVSVQWCSHLLSWPTTNVNSIIHMPIIELQATLIGMGIIKIHSHFWF